MRAATSPGSIGSTTISGWSALVTRKSLSNGPVSASASVPKSRSGGASTWSWPRMSADARVARLPARPRPSVRRATAVPASAAVRRARSRVLVPEPAAVASCGSWATCQSHRRIGSGRPYRRVPSPATYTHSSPMKRAPRVTKVSIASVLPPLDQPVVTTPRPPDLEGGGVQRERPTGQHGQVDRGDQQRHGGQAPLAHDLGRPAQRRDVVDDPSLRLVLAAQDEEGVLGVGGVVEADHPQRARGLQAVDEAHGDVRLAAQRAARRPELAVHRGGLARAGADQPHAAQAVDVVVDGGLRRGSGFHAVTVTIRPPGGRAPA